MTKSLDEMSPFWLKELWVFLSAFACFPLVWTCYPHTASRQLDQDKTVV